MIKVAENPTDLVISQARDIAIKKVYIPKSIQKYLTIKSESLNTNVTTTKSRIELLSK